jgi:hypothetical protein
VRKQPADFILQRATLASPGVGLVLELRALVFEAPFGGYQALGLLGQLGLLLVRPGA